MLPGSIIFQLVPVNPHKFRAFLHSLSNNSLNMWASFFRNQLEVIMFCRVRISWLRSHLNKVLTPTHPFFLILYSEQISQILIKF
jgi:hypothetical protein